MAEQKNMEKIKKTVYTEMHGICFFWITENNPVFSYGIIAMLKQLELTGELQEKQNDLERNWEETFPKFDKSQVPSVAVKNENEELEWLSVASHTIINLFSIGAYEMAYSSLICMSENWKILYNQVIGMLRNLENKEHLSLWLISHFMMALEINNMQKEAMNGNLSDVLASMFHGME